jgi:hypothetical protein
MNTTQGVLRKRENSNTVIIRVLLNACQTDPLLFTHIMQVNKYTKAPIKESKTRSIMQHTYKIKT